MRSASRAALRGTALLVGLVGYGFSMAMMVRAGLGLDPWDVFHQGLAGRTGMTIGARIGGRRAWRCCWPGSRCATGRASARSPT